MEAFWRSRISGEGSALVRPSCCSGCCGSFGSCSGEVAKEGTKPSVGEQKQHLGTGEWSTLCYQGKFKVGAAEKKMVKSHSWRTVCALLRSSFSFFKFYCVCVCFFSLMQSWFTVSSCTLHSRWFRFLFPSRLLQDIEYSALCNKVGPCWLSTFDCIALDSSVYMLILNS